MTPEDAVAATKQTISRTGGAFMLDPATMALAGDLGMSPFPWYYVGRCGVLGAVDADVVHAAMVFFPQAMVRKSWEKGTAALAPAEAAQRYAEVCQDWGRAHLASAPDLDRLAVLLEQLLAAVDPVGMPLFAGWRALPLPDDAPGRVAQLLNVAREHRGAAHGIAVLASDLAPLEAIVSGSYGPDNARFFGWPEPYPDAEPLAAARAEVEAVTDRIVARDYGVLSADELDELVTLCDGVKAAAKAAAAG